MTRDAASEYAGPRTTPRGMHMTAIDSLEVLRLNVPRVEFHLLDRAWIETQLPESARGVVRRVFEVHNEEFGLLVMDLDIGYGIYAGGQSWHVKDIPELVRMVREGFAAT